MLRELPFVGPASAGWGVASTDTTAAWATQGRHQPSGSAGARRDNLLSGCFPEDGDSGRSGAEGARQCFGMESQDPLPGVSPENARSTWSSTPGSKNEKGDVDGILPCWREGHGTGNQDHLDEGINWRKPAWGESGGEREGNGARRDGGQTNTDGNHQEEFAFRGPHSAETNTDQFCEVCGSQ